MNIEELRQRKKDLEDYLRKHDSELKDEERKMFEDQLADIESQILSLEHQQNSRTTGEFVGGKIGRIASGAASFVIGEIDACITGKTDEKDVKRDRARIAAAGEKIGSTIGGMTEKGVRRLSEFIRGRKS